MSASSWSCTEKSSASSVLPSASWFKGCDDVGAPIALAFGLTAALGSAIITMFISTAGTWFGGWLDELIRNYRSQHGYTVLPSSSWWVRFVRIFGHNVDDNHLNMFSRRSSHKAISYKLRVDYIEAAIAYEPVIYVLSRYMIPRHLWLSPVWCRLFLLMSSWKHRLPCWVLTSVVDVGQSHQRCWTFGAQYQGMYYWILEPAVFLMITGFGFALLGFALDRIFNPRLRGM